MRFRTELTSLALAAGLALIAGCHEYQVDVDLRDDGTGTRTTTFETEKDLTPADQRLLAVGGDGWERTTFVGHEGDEVWRYRRRQSVDHLDGWPDSGGTLQRGIEDGSIRLATSVQVEELRGAGRRQLIYRETLYWVGLTEEVAAVVASDYADFLRREFPALPDSLIHEGRGAMAATITRSWAELTGSESSASTEIEYTGAGEEDDPEAKLGARFNAMFGRRLLRAGVQPDLVQEVVRATADWEYFDGVDAAVPGLDHSLSSSFLLTVTMPAPVTGGNADSVAGKVAKFRVELTDVLPAPVTLEVICEG